MKRSKLLIIVLSAMLLLTGGVKGVLAADFPSKPMILSVPTSPGSGASVTTQLMAKLAAKAFGQPVDVLHKPGGNGNVFCSYLAKEKADGYTMGVYVGSMAGYMNLPGFQTSVDDFTYVMNFMRQVHCIYVHQDSPYKTIQDLIKYAKDNPGKLDIGSNKLGSMHFNNVERFAKAAGIQINNIPYKGSGKATKDVMGKHLTAAVTGPFTILAKKKYLRILMVFADERLPGMPDVPAPKDVGLNYQPLYQLWGVMVKKGTPAERVKVIQEAFKKAMADPEYQTLAGKPGNEAKFIDTVEYTKLIKQNTAEIRESLKELKIIK